MKYEPQVYALAEQQLKDRRQANLEKQLKRQQEIYKQSSAIATIDSTLENTGLEVVKSVIGSGDTKELIEGLRLRNEQLLNQKKQYLKQMNYPADYLEPIYTCQICKDSGYVEGKRCACYKGLLAKIAYNTLNENSSLQQTRFENFHLDFYENSPNGKGVIPRNKMSEILTYCKDYATFFNDNSPSLYMFGPTGLGKTHLAMAIACEVLQKGFGVIYSITQNLLSEIEKEHFSFNKDTKTLDNAMQCDLLVLDDFGAEFATPFTIAAVNNIIHTRLNANKPTIITTGLDFKQVEKTYQSRLLSRITGGYVSLSFVGNDIRIYKKVKGIQ